MSIEINLTPNDSVNNNEPKLKWVKVLPVNLDINEMVHNVTESITQVMKKLKMNSINEKIIL